MNPLIITGFCATKDNYEFRRSFFDLWLKNTGDSDIVVIDNNEVTPLAVDNPRVRVIRINHNLGSIESHIGKFRPHLLGFSAGWIIGAMIAYSENRDMLYKEQDCLWFGPALQEIVRRAESTDMLVQMGYAVSAPARVECCLFWVRHGFITEFIVKYMEQSQGDGVKTPEEKFNHIAGSDNRIAPLGFGVGRDRPLPSDHPVWYAQKITADEVEDLKRRGLL